MENKSNTKNVIISILSVLLVLLIVYIGYDKLLKKDAGTISNTSSTTNNSNTSSNQIDETKQPEPAKDAATIFYENMVKNRKVTVDYDHGINIVMDKDGNVYYSAKSIEKSVGTKDEYTIDGYMAGIDENGKMSNVLKGYKLNVSNVVAIYYCASGNGGWMDYVLIKADGTIARLTYSIYTNNNSQVIRIEKFEETVSGYKNIVSVETSNSWDAHGYYLIDINGNIFQ